MKSIFFLTSLEEKVFLSTQEDFLSVTQIALCASAPRTSTFKALQKLETLGLVHSKKVRLKNQHTYSRASDDEIIKRLDLVKKKITSKKDDSTPLHLDKSLFVNVYSGKGSISERLIAMMSQEKGGRIYTLQSSGTGKAWIGRLDEDVLLRIQTLFKERGLIVVGILGASYSDSIKKYKKNLTETLKGRLDDTHIIPDNFLEDKTALYVYKSVTLFVDIEKLHAVEIHNQLFSRVLKKMILYMSNKSPRVRGIYDVNIDDN